MSDIEQFDLVVIGSGPAGEKGAVQAAYFGKRVAMIEKFETVGGACVHQAHCHRRRFAKQRCI